MTRPAVEAGKDPRFVLEEFEPATSRTAREGGLAAKVRAAREDLRDCVSCPRSCHARRIEGQSGFCGTGRHARVASMGPHLGEEDCLRGRRGSGTIFFSGCNLRCVFCQNWDISQEGGGRECTPEEIAALMLDLQARGCHNINFVTPEHVAPQVAEAIAAAVPRGLCLPIVYNTSSYDSLSSLKLMDGLVDIYMPDIKFWRRESSRDFLKAKDYPERAAEAIREMHRQVGVLKMGPDGLARRGVLVRHLVMPGHAGETAEIFRWLAGEISPDTFVNVMAQYHPDHLVGTPGPDGKTLYPQIDRRLTSAELADAHAAARKAGLWRFAEQ